MTTAVEAAAAILEEAGDSPHVVTVGNFDGVHRGHQFLIQQVVDEARRRQVRSLAITFEPHPIAVLRPDHSPERLATADEKLALLRATGLDSVATLEFTPEFAALEPDAFLDLVLATAQPVEVFVGEGFRFGHSRAGDGETIRRFGVAHGFDTTIVTRLHDGDQVISSSKIRAALKAGDVSGAADWLGRRYRLLGTVERGAARGRELGYPTANLTVDPLVCVPGDGIYAALAHLPDGSMAARQALVYIGTRPTFDNGDRLIEAYILDFSGDLYTRELEVEFVAFIRGDRAFVSGEALTAQMQIDERQAREILSRD